MNHLSDEFHFGLQLRRAGYAEHCDGLRRILYAGRVAVLQLNKRAGKICADWDENRLGCGSWQPRALLDRHRHDRVLGHRIKSAHHPDLHAAPNSINSAWPGEWQRIMKNNRASG